MTDEQLVATNEELLLHQLKNPPTMSMALNKDHLYRMMADHMKGAADRIEALTEQLKTVLDREAATTARYDAKTDELEAKLAKALAGLDKAAALIEDRHVVHMTSKGRNPKDYISEWSLIAKEVRALLAEIEGAKL
jgi:hypothetical protein